MRMRERGRTGRRTVKGPACVAIALVLAAAAAGCKGHHPQVGGWMLADPQVRHPIHVMEREAGIDLVVPRGAKGLTRRQMQDARDFVRYYRQQGDRKLMVRAPTGGPNEVASMRGLDDLRHVLAAEYVSPGEVDYKAYYGGGDPHAPIQLSFVRLVAKGPHCGSWPHDLGSDPLNVPYHNFGCATQRNLAAVVADPRDLIEPRHMTPRSSERRDVIWDKWIKGETTGAQRAKEERARAAEVEGGGN